LDERVLVIAAYAHDWGYADLFRDGQKLELQDVVDAKAAHMELGAKKLAVLLEDTFFDFLTLQQKQRAVHLVRVHDRLKSLEAMDELVLMEADTLGGLDVERVRPGFDEDSNRRWMQITKQKRMSRFVTEYAKEVGERLFGEREEYYRRRDE
jgi:hypothetical protein